MRTLRVGIVGLFLVAAACGGTTAEVEINTDVEDMENGTFRANGDLFACEGRWGTLDLHFNEGDTWSFDGDYVCSDGSGALVIRAEGDGPEPAIGQSVGTWTVLLGTGDYEGFSGAGTYDLRINPWTERFVGELTSG